MKIRAARSDDLDAIKALLAENELPASDITADLLTDFTVAEDADGSVVGSVGVERFWPQCAIAVTGGCANCSWGRLGAQPSGAC
jgi:N-acetylglutamate synthase-like GNAT family acetyltransferase